MTIEEIIKERQSYRPPTLEEALQWFPDAVLLGEHVRSPDRFGYTPREMAQEHPKCRGFIVDKKKELNRMVRSVNDHVDAQRPKYQTRKELETMANIEMIHNILIAVYEMDIKWCDDVLFFLNLQKNPGASQQFDLNIQKAKAVPITRFIDFRRKMAPCIWHNEKTPSMHLMEKENKVHCFGCDKSGDTIDVVQALYDKDFKDAVAFLTQ